MKKKLLLLFCLLVTAGSAAWAEIAHGDCKNGSWVIDDSGKLTVNINGDMADYSSLDDVPWYKYRKRITAIHIGSGCTNIGRSAFHLLENVTSVTGGENVEACAKSSFAYCGRDGKGIPLISFPKCDYVGEYAFNDASVVNFSLPLVETYQFLSFDTNPDVCRMADLGSKVKMLKAYSMWGPKYIFIQNPTPPDWERLWHTDLSNSDMYDYPLRRNAIVIVPNEYLNTYINYYPKKHPEVEKGYMCCYYLDDYGSDKNREIGQTGRIYPGGPIYDDGKLVGGWYVDDGNFLRVVLTTDKMPAFEKPIPLTDSSPVLHVMGDAAPWKSVLDYVNDMIIEYVGNKSDITFTIPDYCFNSGLLRNICSIYLKNIDRLVIGREAFLSCEELGAIYDWDVFMNGANENMNVTIGDKAFLDCTNLSFLFGMNINSLGSHAFENCRSFVLDDAMGYFNANYIPESAFENCQSLYYNGYFDFSGVEVIGPNAYRMSGIQEFDLSNVKSVGDNAFAGSEIWKLSFGGSTMNCNFGSKCFGGCTDLTDVYVSEPIKYGFPSDIFSGVTLSDVTLHCEAELYRQYYENHPVFGKMKVDKEFTFPVNGRVGDGTWTLASSGTLSINCSSIPDYSYYREQPWDAYRECIKYIHLRNSQTIGKNAFSELPNLGNVSISLNCREIHDEAFKNCPKLMAINTPVVETLGNNVFEGCTNLEVIQLGKNLTTVGNYVFKNCQSLKTIENRASTPATTAKNSFSSIKSDGQASINLSVADAYVTRYLMDPSWNKFHISYADGRGTWTKAGYFGDGSWILYDDGTMVISAGRSLTGAEAGKLDFGIGYDQIPTDPCMLTKRIEFSGNLGEVPWNCFEDFPNLESVKLCPSIKKIDNRAFRECPKLKSINIENVDTIGEYAFEYAAFETLDLTNAEDIQNGAFARCKNLVEAKLGPVCKLGGAAFIACSKLTTIDISSADIENAGGCLSGCTSLKSATANASRLSNGFFRGCTALETVRLGSKLESIEYDSFEGCTGLRYIYINRATPPALPMDYRGKNVGEVGMEWEEAWPFDDLTLSNIHLIVPPDFVAAYKAANIWKDMIVESNNEIVEPALPTGGSIGQNGTWYLGTDGTLVVDVSGDIPATDSEGKPWCDTFNAWVGLIKAVVFTDNVKSIPDNFFGGTYFADASAGVETVTLGRFLKSVGKKSLSFSGIKDVYVYSENLLEMQDNTFNLDAAAKNNATLHILKTSDGYYYAANPATTRFHIAADLDTNKMMKCGTLGTQGYWTFVDGVLTVNYNGAMPTLTSRTDHIDDPETAYRFKWIDFLSEIEEIVITGKDVEIQPYFLYYEGEGTSDGQHPDDHIKTVTLGDGVKSLGRGSLSLYELKRVNCYGVNAPTLPVPNKAFWEKRITANLAFLWTVPNASTDYALINSEWAKFNHSAHKLNPYDMPTQETLADFETGKLNQIPFISEGDYPWDITGEDAESGSFSMRSGNKGVANSSSAISAMYLYGTDGFIIFDAKFMGEGSGDGWDKCIFYIDGEQQFSYGARGNGWFVSNTFPVKAGMHIFKWEYTKDSSVDAEGDAFYVDNIYFLQEGQDNDLITGLEDLKDLRDSKDFKDSWFDLSGRKLTGKPEQPGLYINGGRKVVIK